MATTRNIPNRLQYPGLGNELVFDTFRGRVRVRKWPKKRGTPKSKTVRLINSRFAQATYIGKRCDAGQVVTAMEAVKGSGLYPRDLLARYILNCPVVLLLPNGQSIEKEHPGVIPVSFQGARVERTSAQTLAAGVLTTLVWQTPVIDTAAFFSASSATRLTVPPGVAKLRIEAGLITNSATAGLYSIRVGKNGVFTLAGSRASTDGLGRLSLSTGPINVVPGDFFEVQAVCTTAHTALAEPGTFLSAEVLEAA
jgi:hypothetical protein